MLNEALTTCGGKCAPIRESETCYLRLCVPPILEYQIDPGFSNGLEILAVAGYQRPIQPNGYGGNQAIREFKSRTVLSCCRFDRGGGEVVSGSGRNFFVLVEPFHRPFQLTGGGLQFKTVDDLVNCDAREGENAVLFSVATRVLDDGPIMPLEVFGKDVCVQNGFNHRLERGCSFRWPPSFLVGNG